MPTATVDVSKDLIADTLFCGEVRVVKIEDSPHYAFARLTIEGEQLPPPRKTGELRQVTCTVHMKVKTVTFSAI